MKEQINEIIKSKDLKKITFDIVEKVLDSQIEDEILKEVPLIKSIIAARNIYNSYSDKIFIKKAMVVLLELNDVSSEERSNFVSELDNKFESGTEKILMAINHLDSIRKCSIYGKLCRMKATGKLDKYMFLKMSKLIQDAFLEDVFLIIELNRKEKNNISEFDYYPLNSLGLICQEYDEQEPIEVVESTFDGYAKVKGGGINFYYVLTELGNVVYDNFEELFGEIYYGSKANK